MKCVIFRCSKKDEMYLYVPYQDNPDNLLANLPQGLKQVTGRLEKVLDLELTVDRKLARASTDEVINSLQQKGFYLQMPPNDILRKDESMLSNTSDSF